MSHGSPLSIDYEKLESLLSRGQWKEADHETNQILEKAETLERRKREQDPMFRASKDIKIIDRLWNQASQGHFGFSIQAQIYRSWGGKDSLGKTSKQVWKDFCKEVAWNARPITNRSLGSTILNYNNQAVKGHLPSFAEKNTGLDRFELSLKNLNDGFFDRFLTKTCWNWENILDLLQLP